MITAHESNLNRARISHAPSPTVEVIVRVGREVKLLEYPGPVENAERLALDLMRATKEITYIDVVAGAMTYRAVSRCACGVVFSRVEGVVVEDDAACDGCRERAGLHETVTT